jgi:PPOX class probable F420-dependent enzyme
MPAKLTANAIRLIEGKNFAHLATLMPDGSPQVTPVWIDHDGDVIFVNTAYGRAKQKNSATDRRVAISIINQDDPYDKVIVQGRVLDQTFEGAEAHIDKLAKKYTGLEKYQKSGPNEKRIITRIEPTKII